MLSRRTLVLAAILLPGMAANAALEARDLDGEASTAEAWYDTLLDITWLADANLAQTRGDHFNGRMTWSQANSWVEGLSFTLPGSGRVLDDWRLPVSRPLNGVAHVLEIRPDGSADKGYNISGSGTLYAGSTAHELAHLYHVTLGNPGYLKVDGLRSGCDAEMASPNRCLMHTGPFTNIGQEGGVYWTGTSFGSIWGALVFSLGSGSEFTYVLGGDFYAWAVHPGDVAAPVPEPGTWALWGAGLVALARVRRPSRWRS